MQHLNQQLSELNMVYSAKITIIIMPEIDMINTYILIINIIQQVDNYTIETVECGWQEILHSLMTCLPTTITPFKT